MTMGKRRSKPAAPRTSPSRWWCGYLGGFLLLVLSLAAVAASAQIESGGVAFAVGLCLVTIVVGGCFAAFGVDVLPAALLAIAGLLFFGFGLRTVLPRPATTFEFSAHRLLPQYAGSHTVAGARKSPSVTHTVVPIVARDWQHGQVLGVWVFDPPPKALQQGNVLGLRLSLSDRDTARAAWQAARVTHALPQPATEPTFVELLPDPQAHDERRLVWMFAALLFLLALWLIGKPLAWAWASMRRGSREAAAPTRR